VCVCVCLSLSPSPSPLPPPSLSVFKSFDWLSTMDWGKSVFSGMILTMWGKRTWDVIGVGGWDKPLVKPLVKPLAELSAEFMTREGIHTEEQFDSKSL
jgi:hypothetical protein